MLENGHQVEVYSFTGSEWLEFTSSMVYLSSVYKKEGEEIARSNIRFVPCVQSDGLKAD